MDLSFLPAWPLHWPNAISIAALALLSVVLGEVAARWIHVPRLLGYLAAGAAFGAAGQMVDALRFEGLPRATLDNALNFTAAIVLFELGQRVSFGWLRRNPALLATSVLESALSFAAVFFVLRLFHMSPIASALIAAISMSTSPGVVLSVTRELRAQGQVTERSLLLTALNSIYAVVVATLLMAWAYVDKRGVLDDFVLHPLYLVLGSILLAAIAAKLLLEVLAYTGRERAAHVMVMTACVGIVFAAAEMLQLSSPLALLACGAFVRSFDHGRRLAHTDFGLVSAIALVLFFALSASSLDYSLLAAAWLPALALAVVRVATKLGVTTALAPMSGLTWQRGALTGLCLMPMSVLALVLAGQVATVNVQLAEQTRAVLVGSVAVLETFGALALAFSLRRAGEARFES